MDKETPVADNIEITINNKEKFTGRLLGLIDSDDYTAAVNTENAARRIYSSESTPLKDLDMQEISGKCFVVATSNYSSDNRREIFISPTIRYSSIVHHQRSYKCEDDNEYKLREL